MKKQYDVIIVGAGISGLACARELIKQNKSVLILEARGRVGGRMFTRHDSFNQSPIELGAEFIHGEYPSIIDELETAGKSFYDISDSHFYVDNDRKKVDFWDRLEKIENKYAIDRKKDRSVREFIDGQKSIDAISKKLFLGFIEGFEAADSNLISEKAMAYAHKENQNSDVDSKNFRIVRGYEDLLDCYVKALQPHSDMIRLNTTVKNIKWKKNKVTVFCSSTLNELVSFDAKKIVLTLPIGVLKSAPASAAFWEPMPKGLSEWLNGFQMGHIQRIVFLFRSRFWEETVPKNVSFIMTGSENFFPTWWTQSPLRTSMLVAWQGGPKAIELSHLPIEKRVEIALRTLTKMLNIPMHTIHSQLLRWYHHDWSNDPFSQGAYSYISVGGVPSWKKFLEPIDHTIYFAGEAFSSHAKRGTVHGALESGVGVAQKITQGSK